MPVCECCYKDEKLHIHHRTYKSLGKEKLHQLSLVCELCHSMIHQLVLTKPCTLWKASMFAKKIMKEDRLAREASWHEPKEIDYTKLDKEAASANNAYKGFNFTSTFKLIKKSLISVKA